MFKDKDVFLFDLDGTLLTIETEEFLKYYFGALSASFKDLCKKEENFIKILMNSTEKMIKNDGSRSNQQAFMEEFMGEIGIDDKSEFEKIKLSFDQFYQNEFAALEKYFDVDKKIPYQIIEFLKKKNKKLVLATNPLFPIEAVEKRLGWTGINPADFKLLTHYENMSHAKPNPNYYQEILEKIDVKAENCLMIGNDLKEDGAASELGIKTVIIEDKLIPRESVNYPIEWQGTLVEFKEILKKEL